MKYFVFLSCICISLAVAAQSTTEKVRTNGIYMTDAKIDKDGDTHYIRFYPKGEVITVTSTGKAQDVKKWFNLKAKGVSKGKFTITGKKLSFSSVWSDVTVDYNGNILPDDKLQLHSKSLKNGYETDMLLHFVKLKGLK